MNIVLIGMRGSGKTTIGKMLAKRLNRRFIETDQLIEKKMGKKTKDIVEQDGWSKFRETEFEIVQEITLSKNAVIATGGGVILSEKNVKALKKNGRLIWLLAPPELLLKRIGKDPNRPLLSQADTMKEDLYNTWKIRKPLYKKASDCIIRCSTLTINQIVSKCIELTLDIS